MSTTNMSNTKNNTSLIVSAGLALAVYLLGILGFPPEANGNWIRHALILTVLAGSVGIFTFYLGQEPGRVEISSLRGVRIGFALLLLVCALFLLAVGADFLVNAAEIADTETWRAGFGKKNVWPFASWGLLFGVVALGGAGLLLKASPEQGDQAAWLSKNIANMLVAGAVASLCVLGYMLATQSVDAVNMWVFAFSLMAGATLAVSAFILISDTASQDPARLRLVLAVTGLILGGMAFLLSIILTVTTFRTEISEGLDNWVKNPSVLIWPALAYLGGLALLFAAVQPAEPLVRTDQNIRRVVFGTNLSVTVLLLLGVLALPNILAYAEPFNSYFGRGYNWTKSGLHSLQPITRNFLMGMRNPVKVYVIMPSNSVVTADVVTMLENCRSINDQKFRWELVDPSADEDRFRAVLARHNQPIQMGLLVTTAGEEKSEAIMIKQRDLSDRVAPNTPYKFKGESALINALANLAEGQIKIYFTTGHGEMVIGAGAKQQGELLEGAELSTLRQQLTSRESIKVDSLSFNEGTKIPDDASILFVVQPTREFSEKEIDILRSYLKRKRETRKEKGKDDIEREVDVVSAGKLVLMSGPSDQRIAGQSGIPKTGLDKLLLEYGIELGEGRVLNVLGRPLAFTVVTDPRSQNNLAKAFQIGGRPTTGFAVENARIVDIVEGRGSSAERLLIDYPPMDQQIFLSTDFETEPASQVTAIQKRPNELQRRIRNDGKLICVAATATEGGRAGMPKDDFHGGAVGGGTPRLVVFGSYSWVTNKGLNQESPLTADRLALLNSCVSWLHDKSNFVGGLPEKERQPYNLGIPAEHHLRLRLLPFALMVTMVLILGAGVWVVRRR